MCFSLLIYVCELLTAHMYVCVLFGAHTSEPTVCPTDSCGTPLDGLLLVVVCWWDKKQMWWRATADNWGAKGKGTRCQVCPGPGGPSTTGHSPTWLTNAILKHSHRTQDTGNPLDWMLSPRLTWVMQAIHLVTFIGAQFGQYFPPNIGT